MDKKTIGEEKLMKEINKTEGLVELKDIDNYEESLEEKYNKEESYEIKNDISNLETNIDSKNSNNNLESSDKSGPIGKKIMKTIFSNLNSYWIEFILQLI